MMATGPTATLADEMPQPIHLEGRSTDGVTAMRLAMQAGITSPVIDVVIGASEGGSVCHLTLRASSPADLRARLEGLLRPSHRHPAGSQRIGRLRIDRAGHRAFVDRVDLQLSPKQWEVLSFLAHRPGQVVTRESLLNAIWGWNRPHPHKTVDVHIRWLRQRFAGFGPIGFQISTVRGTGYRFDIHPVNGHP